MDYIINHIPMLEGIKTLLPLLMLTELMFSILNCFCGYKLLKFWVAACGFMIGAVGGFLVISRFSAERTVVFGTAVAAGLVAGLLAYEVYLVGVFFLGWLMTVSVVTVLGRSLEISDREKLIILASGLVLGVIVGVLIVMFARPSIIILTGISGGISTAATVFSFLEKEQPMIIVAAAGLVLAAVGIFVQFKTTPSSKS